MAKKRIQEIVQKVYQKANENCVSHAKNALAIHVEDEIFNMYKKKISYKTVERAFDKHIFNDTTASERNSESICLLCKYLGFDDYKDYVRKNSSIFKKRYKKKLFSWKFIVILNIAFGIVLTTTFVFKNINFTYTDQPLIWYYKDSSGEIEYLVAPNLYPLNIENSHKVIPYNNQNHMPIHTDKKELYLP